GSYSHTGASTREGVDIDTSNNADEEIFAPVSGVAYVHDYGTGFGLHVNIDLGNGTFANLSHNSDLFIADGSAVEQGQLLGLDGCTGSCTGDHTHIGLLEGDASEPAQNSDSIPISFYTRDVTADEEVGIYDNTELVCGNSGHFYQSYLPVVRWLPDGTLVKGATHPDVFVKDGDEFFLLEDEAVFWSYNFSFSETVLVSEAFIACQNFGNSLTAPACYRAVEDASGNAYIAFECENIAGKYRQAVYPGARDAVLESWGIYTAHQHNSAIGASILANYPLHSGYARLRDGALVRETGMPDVYAVDSGSALPIETEEVFRLMGFAGRTVLEVPYGALNYIVLSRGSCASGIGCIDKATVTICNSGGVGVGGEGVADMDGDGWNMGEDCNDEDPSAYPGAEEICGNWEDEDCDGQDIECPPQDNDSDGWAQDNGDCNDANASINPGASEVPCDNADNDCNAATLDVPDADGDGASVCSDCDDSDPNNEPGKVEICDNADNDCDGLADELFDIDGDGWTTCEGDCADTNASVNPSRAEIVCDSVNNDCNSQTQDSPDADGDGAGVCADCNDANASVHVGATEICNSADDDCDSAVDEGGVCVPNPNTVDNDSDGYTENQGDCADSDASVHPNASEGCNGVDNDCNGVPASNEADSDSDEWRVCEGDCADSDALVHPAMTELQCNSKNDDCNSQTQDSPDADGDGAGVCVDCNDANASVHALATEVCGNGVDDNCDGLDLVCPPADSDSDGIADGQDNCPQIVNAGQSNFDSDGEGDVCDADDDGDGSNDPYDCAPYNSARYPGATEVCNGTDDDCDSAIDEGLSYDADADGYYSIGSCRAPATDCWDQNSAVNPNAQELCGNGIDDDCSGSDAECPPCERDTDGDGVVDCLDNCLLTDNSDQQDADSDGIGNSCDAHNDIVYPLLTVDAVLSGPPATYMDMDGELLRADGTPDYWWSQLSYAQNTNTLHYEAYVDSGWTLRFSVEYRRNNVVSWSCVAPFPPGTLTMQVTASVDGVPVQVTAINNHLGGCELFVEVP
ncbi:TPA: hypothetical protein DCZ32_02905, partial [Candidatus Uhrbacteria bacterium]|nr:hypothetical protein [Candidatus Uhrbacteria bacterium]